MEMSEFPIPCSIVYKNSFENKRLVHSPYILTTSLSLKKKSCEKQWMKAYQQPAQNKGSLSTSVGETITH
ncbi:hypothetical protein DLS44_13380 [Staphylococcus pseudintermedius]|nr:hypothetical protein [Staphylococcus pseudintermedius]RYS17466.1 hypothetical protein DLS48_13425 [Staphylococcus pseudintermedius]RYS31162.1 hypothetical protein DLS44_13380 [Staphylococcus pseudintermedius]